jgi:hypothetical protein
VTTRRSRSNRRALDEVVAFLREGELLDERVSALVTLAETSADLVDLVCAPDSSTPVYARVKAVQAHASLLDQLGLLAPVEPDAFAQFIEMLSSPTREETSGRFD